MPCASACSCSTVRSAPGCRATISAPTTSAGSTLEGCNEHLVLTRPDLVSQMHAEFFDAGVDAVETATFGAFPLVLNEYQIPEKTFEINEQAAQIAKEVASVVLDPRPAAVRDRLDRARHEAALARPHPLRRAPRRLRGPGRRAARRRRRRAARRDRLRPPAGEGRDQRRPAGDGAPRACCCRSWCRSRSRRRAACSSAPRSAPRSPRSKRCAPTSSA